MPISYKHEYKDNEGSYTEVGFDIDEYGIRLTSYPHKYQAFWNSAATALEFIQAVNGLVDTTSKKSDIRKSPTSMADFTYSSPENIDVGPISGSLWTEDDTHSIDFTISPTESLEVNEIPLDKKRFEDSSISTIEISFGRTSITWIADHNSRDKDCPNKIEIVAPADDSNLLRNLYLSTFCGEIESIQAGETVVEAVKYIDKIK